MDDLTLGGVEPVLEGYFLDFGVGRTSVSDFVALTFVCPAGTSSSVERRPFFPAALSSFTAADVSLSFGVCILPPFMSYATLPRATRVDFLPFLTTVASCAMPLQEL